MKEQYGGLGDPFVNAAVELALIFADIPKDALDAWFKNGLEQQSLSLNRSLRNLSLKPSDEELAACYRASYVSMIISLNYMSPTPNYSRWRRGVVRELCRPDFHCMILLLRAQGWPKPRWWDDPFVKMQLDREKMSLNGEQWKDAAAWLLGLGSCPGEEEFSNWIL